MNWIQYSPKKYIYYYIVYTHYIYSIVKYILYNIDRYSTFCDTLIAKRSSSSKTHPCNPTPVIAIYIIIIIIIYSRQTRVSHTFVQRNDILCIQYNNIAVIIIFLIVSNASIMINNNNNILRSVSNRVI